MDQSLPAVGHVHEERMTISADMVRQYALVTGDTNPIHLDPVFAAATRFGKPIVHGALLVGFVSRILGATFPGPGTVYLAQTIEFRRPVYVGDLVRIVVELLEREPGGNRATLATNVVLEDGTLCASGMARVRLPQLVS